MHSKDITSKAGSDSVLAGEKHLGYASEMFCSIQGEGPYVGEQQVFFRTAGCSATCYWCDTVSSKKERKLCLVHGREKRSLVNPITVDQSVDAVMSLVNENASVRTVSITGGEPLEQSDFVARVASRLADLGLRVYLETSGLEPDGLSDVLPFVDVVSMDVKLPSATGVSHWDTHREFIHRAYGKELFVKMVVDFSTPIREIEQAVQLLSEIDRRIPLVLQPESSTFLKEANGPEGKKQLVSVLETGQRFAAELLDDVRVIPQVHKILKVR